LSIEDLGNQRSNLEPYLNRFPELVLTAGGNGAELHTRGTFELVPAVRHREVDPTGAGDIFAAAYMVAKVVYHKTPRQAAELAHALAGISVTRPGTAGIPTVNEIKEVLKV
jgi:sugar/nucleoside kinase (ribokinase family)